VKSAIDEPFNIGAAGFDHYHVTQRLDQGRLRRLGGGAQLFIRGRKRRRRSERQRDESN
jgi:hypothetical protein